MAARKVIRIMVIGAARPATSVEEMTRIVLALGRELAQRPKRNHSERAGEETTG